MSAPVVTTAVIETLPPEPRPEIRTYQRRRMRDAFLRHVEMKHPDAYWAWRAMDGDARACLLFSPALEAKWRALVAMFPIGAL